MKRLTWNAYALQVAEAAAARSEDPWCPVGAAVLRPDHSIAGLGYNGPPAGINLSWADRKTRRAYVIHAEMNALLQCAKFGAKTEEAEIYVTHFPCLQCCKAIIQSGITAVYYAQDYKNHPYAIELFEQANVTVKHVPLEYDIAALEDQKRYTELKELFVSLEKDNLSMEELQHVFTKAKMML